MGREEGETPDDSPQTSAASSLAPPPCLNLNCACTLVCPYPHAPADLCLPEKGHSAMALEAGTPPSCAWGGGRVSMGIKQCMRMWQGVGLWVRAPLSMVR